MAFVHCDFRLDFRSSVNVLFVEIVIDRLHSRGRISVGPAILINDLHDQLVQAVHMIHLLSSNVAYDARYLRVLLSVFERHADVTVGILDLFGDLLAQLLDDLHNQHTFVTVMFASAIVAAEPETTCSETGEAQQQQELSRSHCTNVVKERLVPVLWAWG